MSLRGNKGVGIPTVLVHEGEGLVVTIETKAGYLHRGVMEVTQDNMNTSLKEVICTSPEGVVTRLEKVYLRGSQIVFIIFPDMMRHAPMFRRLQMASQGKVVAGGLGRGRQAAISATVAKKQAEAAREMSMKARGVPMSMPRGLPGPTAAIGGAYAGAAPYGVVSGGMQPPPRAPMGMPPPTSAPPYGRPLPPQDAFAPRGMPPPMGRGRGAEMTRPAWMQH